ncbi:hypothetical protein ACWDOR_37215 [Streptosporangium canum]|uniref:hypothetical protein n=1 Tax=Streptosporangium canum TaxID=324952 RepID=UPI0036CA0945
MARGDLTDDERVLDEPRLPLGERGPVPELRERDKQPRRVSRTKTGRNAAG